MSNPFVDIVKEAEKLKWCTTLYCTTCAATEYRLALKKLRGDFGGPLADALTDIDLKEVTKLTNWQDALLIALNDLPLSSLQIAGILNAWIAKAKDDDINFLNLILFKVIKYLPLNNEYNVVRNKWISHCVGLAIRTKYPSLIESLFLVLKQEALANVELIEIAKNYAKNSAQMRRVLLNTCGLKISTE